MKPKKTYALSLIIASNDGSNENQRVVTFSGNDLAAIGIAAADRYSSEVVALLEELGISEDDDCVISDDFQLGGFLFRDGSVTKRVAVVRNEQSEVVQVAVPKM